MYFRDKEGQLNTASLSQHPSRRGIHCNRKIQEVLYGLDHSSRDYYAMTPQQVEKLIEVGKDVKIIKKILDMVVDFSTEDLKKAGEYFSSTMKFDPQLL